MNAISGIATGRGILEQFVNRCIRGGKPRFQNNIILRTVIKITQRRAIIRIN
jgi:hypothetical protein